MKTLFLGSSDCGFTSSLTLNHETRSGYFIVDDKCPLVLPSMTKIQHLRTLDR